MLRLQAVCKRFGSRAALVDVELELYRGEVLAIVGESGSGKTTLLDCIAAAQTPDAGAVRYRTAQGEWVDVHALPESRRRLLARTEWGYVGQHAEANLRMHVSAGANVVERLMGLGERRYGTLRGAAHDWMSRVELDPARIDDMPATFSGGMRQRVQIARSLVTRPRLLLMDEPTSGLDVSVQARLLDLIRALVRQLRLSIVLVTHDLAVARLLAQRVAVMRDGEVVETGLTDRVFDDPQHPYTQLLVSSVLG
ncbi:MAG: phosphonate C-P lyase system protein PhnK [Burkholderiaceae bacterium]